MQENPHEDPEWRLAYKMLKDGGFSLPWIETRREIEEALERALADLRRSWARRQDELARSQPNQPVQNEWERAVQAFRQRAADLNRSIQDYNLKIPNAQFFRIKINADKEIERITQSG